MTDDELRARAREAIAHLPRGECTVFSSDDAEQPAGTPCIQRRCEMCDGDCPDPHVHVYERAFLLDHPLPEEPQLGYSAAAWDEMRDGVRRIGEQLSARPVGCCSEACALRFVGGEPTLHEVATADKIPDVPLMAKPAARDAMARFARGYSPTHGTDLVDER